MSGGVAEGDVPVGGTAEVVPRLRGLLHHGVAYLAPVAGLVLVFKATGVARVGAAVYATALIALFWSSAYYHRIAKTPNQKLWARRVDHSAIFVFIAASYTVMATAVLRLAAALVVLGVVWTVAVGGVAAKLALLGPRNRVISWLYSALGWAAVVLLPTLVSELTSVGLLTLLAGGVAFTGGALILLARSPNPIPGVLGYHEVWHAAVVVGVALQFVTWWTAV